MACIRCIMLTKFLFIRHGETEYNRQMRLQGQRDCPLSELGVRQAQLVAQALADEKFDIAYVSDLSRTKVTAQEIMKYHPGVPVVYTSKLRERDFGVLVGHTREEYTKLYPEVTKGLASRDPELLIPEGEGTRAFNLRVIGVLTEMRDKNPGKNILVVSHGGVLMRVFQFLSGTLSDWNMAPLSPNTAINRFVYHEDRGKWQLTEWGNATHLKQLKTDSVEL